MSQAKVLIVEDRSNWRSTVVKLLQAENCSLVCAHNVAEAESYISNNDFDLVITNMILEEGIPLLGGLQVLDKIRSSRSKPLCIVLSECQSYPTAVRIHNEYRDIVYAIISKSEPWVDHTHFLQKCREALAAGSPLRKKPILEAEEERLRIEAKIRNEFQESDSKAGEIFRHLTEDPVKGLEKLIAVLADVPELAEKRSALGVRLATIKELEQRQQSVGKLTDTQEVDKRDAVRFAIDVCLQLERILSKNN